MEFEVAAPNPLSPSPSKACEEKLDEDRLRVKRKTLQAVLDQCQRALELLNNADGAAAAAADDDDRVPDLEEFRDRELTRRSSFDSLADREADELCDLLKSRVECPDFLEKLECAQASLPHEITVGEECSSWDMVNENDLWEGEIGHSEQEDFVLVRQEDIVDGIACFMAAYLLSLKQTKVSLSKTFSVKKRKGKLRKAWDGSKVIYNVASWGATAIGIYQNPVILRAATNAFWTSCHIISKLL
ncbi:unnamed protein product [Linum tenue]|uniref:MADS box interactor-like n=2 Tax=Linum tenue TaxID=586396 RepID=A0AAV0MPL1_9ROSI|nr:unnamed protein product [Linum tenue]